MLQNNTLFSKIWRPCLVYFGAKGINRCPLHNEFTVWNISHLILDSIIMTLYLVATSVYNVPCMLFFLCLCAMIHESCDIVSQSFSYSLEPSAHMISQSQWTKLERHGKATYYQTRATRNTVRNWHTIMVAYFYQNYLCPLYQNTYGMKIFVRLEPHLKFAVLLFTKTVFCCYFWHLKVFGNNIWIFRTKNMLSNTKL